MKNDSEFMKRVREAIRIAARRSPVALVWGRLKKPTLWAPQKRQIQKWSTPCS